MIAIIISVILIFVVIAIDQASKYAIVALFGIWDHLGKNAEAMDKVAHGLESINIIPGIFRLSFVVNDGAAFGSMDDNRWLFMILSTVAIVAIIVYMFWKKPQNPLLLTSLVLITGGGIGNMIDRIALGYVIDFLDFAPAFAVNRVPFNLIANLINLDPRIVSLWPWVFNVADSCVCVGAALMALWLILDMIKEAKKDKVKKLTDAVTKVKADSDGEEKPQDNGGENE